MHGKSIYKGEKLIKISMEYDEKNKLITGIRIEGDFFIYPESGREKLEMSLKGAKLEEAGIAKIVDDTLKKENVEAYGFNGEQIAKAIMLACTPAPNA